MLDNGPYVLGIMSQFRIMSSSGLCRLWHYVAFRVMSFGIMSHSGLCLFSIMLHLALCRIQPYVVRLYVIRRNVAQPNVIRRNVVLPTVSVSTHPVVTTESSYKNSQPPP